MATKEKKTFVLDTNVLLHDFNCLNHFDEHDIVIPITVLEELDKFKKGHDQINFNARSIARTLGEISTEGVFDKGISLGKNKGKLFIETGKPYTKEFRDSFPADTPDHRILSIALHVQSNRSTPVILVSKDINLRLKAKAMRLESEDYETDKVQKIENIYEEVRTINKISDETISKLYETPEIPLKELNLDFTPTPNQFFILQGNNSSALSMYDPTSNSVRRIEKYRQYGIEPRNAEQTFALAALMNDNLPLVSITGKAGTGKTLLALAAALAQEKQYVQILLARPIVPLSNRDLGYLPGDVNEKIGPYMQPLYDNLGVIKQQFKSNSKQYMRIEEMLKDDKLKITPLAYIRGRSLSNVFFIVDEAQNLTPHEIKTIITRAGEGTKIVFTGDIQQIDSPYLDMRSNGLSYLTDRMRSQELFGHIHLVKGERSMLAELASDLL
ncbi:MAG: PhoH family protein [Salinivirgaceae bacterium]